MEHRTDCPMRSLAATDRLNAERHERSAACMTPSYGFPEAQFPTASRRATIPDDATTAIECQRVSRSTCSVARGCMRRLTSRACWRRKTDGNDPGGRRAVEHRRARYWHGDRYSEDSGSNRQGHECLQTSRCAHCVHDGTARHCHDGSRRQGAASRWNCRSEPTSLLVAAPSTAGELPTVRHGGTTPLGDRSSSDATQRFALISFANSDELGCQAADMALSRAVPLSAARR